MGTGRVLPDWLSGQRLQIIVRKFELIKRLGIFEIFLALLFKLFVS